MSNGRVVEDADPYGWVRDGRFSNHPAKSQAAARGASRTPPLTGWISNAGILIYVKCSAAKRNGAPGTVRPTGVGAYRTQGRAGTPSPTSGDRRFSNRIAGLDFSLAYREIKWIKWIKVTCPVLLGRPCPLIMHPPTTLDKPPGMVTERLLSSIAYVRDALSAATRRR